MVNIGDSVTKGQVLGVMGDVGTDGGIYLHFEIRPPGSTVQADAVNPIPLLPTRPNSITLAEGVVEQNGTLDNNCSE